VRYPLPEIFWVHGKNIIKSTAMEKDDRKRLKCL